jgi:dTDP-glucose pyrophosphorylase
MKRLLLVPAAGRAVRMGGLLKELLPVGTRTGDDGVARVPAPMLSHAFDAGVAAGVDRATVVTSSTKVSMLMDAVEALRLPFPVSYVQQSTPAGLGAAVLTAAADIAASDETLMVMPDTIIRPVDAPSRAASLLGGAVIGVTLHRAPEPTRFGVAKLDQGGNLIGFVDKPAEPPSAWVWTSAAFTAAFLELIERVRSPERELGLTEALDLAAKEEGIAAWFVEDGVYHDVGTYEDYVAAVSTVEQ